MRNKYDLNRLCHFVQHDFHIRWCSYRLTVTGSYHQWSRNWLPFRRSWVGVVLLNLYTRTRYVPFVVITIPSFLISSFTTGYFTVVIWRLPLVAKVPFNYAEQINISPGFACFALLNLCFFYLKIIVLLFFFPKPLYCLSLFDLRIWLLLWYFQTLLEFEHSNKYINIHFECKECAAI